MTTPDRQLGGTRRDTDVLDRTGDPDPWHIVCCKLPFERARCGAELDLTVYLTEHIADCRVCFLAVEMSGEGNCPIGLGVCP